MNSRKRIIIFFVVVFLLLLGLPSGLFWRVYHQARLNDALIEAVKRHNLDEVDLLLEQGADIETRGSLDQKPVPRTFWQIVFMRENKQLKYPTALTLAVFTGQIDMVQLLLKKGANANARYSLGYTPLRLEATFGNVAIVRILLKYGADVNTKAEDGWTPLMVFAEMGDTEIVKALIDAGADVNARIKNETPLSLAAGRLTGAQRFHDTSQIAKQREVMLLLRAAGATE